jgi:hypothetical protein
MAGVYHKYLKRQAKQQNSASQPTLDTATRLYESCLKNGGLRDKSLLLSELFPSFVLLYVFLTTVADTS